MYCKKCGGQNADNVKFCKYCGSMIVADNVSTVAAGSLNNISIGKKKKSKKKTIVIFTIIYLFLHIIFDIVGIAGFTKIDVKTPSTIVFDSSQSQSPYAEYADHSWNVTYKYDVKFYNIKLGEGVVRDGQSNIKRNNSGIAAFWGINGFITVIYIFSITLIIRIHKRC